MVKNIQKAKYLLGGKSKKSIFAPQLIMNPIKNLIAHISNHQSINLKSLNLNYL